MILVDTSVWIEFFRGNFDFSGKATPEFEEVVTCLPVIQEVLQGFDNQKAYNVARDAMHALPIVESPMSEEVFQMAIDLYRSSRRAGMTLRSSVDCLLGACALRNSLPVLHHDRDFDSLSRISSLETWRI